MKCQFCDAEQRLPVLVFEKLAIYPHVRAKFACDECSTGNFLYYITAGQMNLDGYASWRAHMSAKTWFSAACVEPLQKLARLANAMPRKEIPPDSEPHPKARCVSTRMRAEIMERDNFLCRRCGAGPQEALLVVDHVHPVARGGRAEMDNLQTLCVPCNCGKRERRPHPHDLVLLP